MASQQSIGNLSATVTANASQLIQEFQKAQNAINQVGNNVNNGAQKIAKGISTAALSWQVFRLAIRAVETVVRDVIQNIDSIPGVPESTIESIHQMKYALDGPNAALKQGAAAMVGWFSEVGTGVGYALGALRYGWNSATRGFQAMQQEADAWANKDFTTKLAKLQEQFDQLNVHSKGQMAAMLNDESAALQSFASTGIVALGHYNDAVLKALQQQMALQGGATPADRHDAQLKAMQDKIEAQRTVNGLVQQMKTEMDSVGALIDKQHFGTLSTADALKQVNEQLSALYMRKMPNLSLPSSAIDPVQLERAVEGWKKIKVLEQEHLALLKKMNGEIGKFGSSIADTWIKSIEGSGHAWKDLGRTIIEQIFKIGIESEVLTPLFHALGAVATSAGMSSWGGALSSFAFAGGFASGGDPPVGRVSLVGEQGPELFVPRTAGTIVPAGATASALRGRRGDAYYIDATGADKAAIARLAGAIASINGSVEMRSVSAVLAQAKRSPSFRRSLSA